MKSCDKQTFVMETLVMENFITEIFITEIFMIFITENNFHDERITVTEKLESCD